MKNCGLIILICLILFFVLFNSMTTEPFRGWRRRGRRRHPHRGYRYGPHPSPRYYPWWNYGYWFRGSCKNGCTSLGRGNWGCQYPGSNPNDCWFATDCYGCGY